MTICRLYGASLLAIATLLPVGAAAQDQRLPTREQLELPEPQLPDAVRPRVETSAVSEVPCRIAQGGTVAVRETRFVDARGGALPDEITRLLAPLAAPEEADGQALCALGTRATRILGAAGYIAAIVNPASLPDDGVATYQVVLGRITQLDIVGARGARLEDRAGRLRAIYPLRNADIDREIRIASDAPGRTTRVRLRPVPGQPGDIEGTIETTSVPWRATAFAGTGGSGALGPISLGARVDAFGLTGMDDLTFLGVAASGDLKEYRTIQGGHYFRLASGLQLGGDISYTWARPDVPPLDLRSRSLLAAIEMRYPLILEYGRSVAVEGGLEIVDQTTDFGSGAAALPLTRDRLRVLFARLSATGDAHDRAGLRTGSWFATLEARKGLQALGASRKNAGPVPGGYFPSRLDGNPAAFVLRGQTGATRYFGRVGLTTRLQGQWASDPLLAFEEFSVGNYTIGRGYDPGATAGDKALGAVVEPSVTLPAAGRVVPQIYAFADAIRIWNDDRFTIENGRTLASAGLGLRLYLPGTLTIDAAWAHPFDPATAVPGARRSADRFLLSTSLAFGPRAR